MLLMHDKTAASRQLHEAPGCCCDFSWSRTRYKHTFPQWAVLLLSGLGVPCAVEDVAHCYSSVAHDPPARAGHDAGAW